MSDYQLITGDALTELVKLPAGSVQCCVTSPPYWGLRDYGHDGQLGQEESPAAFAESMVAIFREVRRVLKDDGTLWLNLGDSYASSAKGSGGPSDMQDSNAGARYDLKRFDLKAKDLVGIPWLVAFALRADGWYLRSDIIWSKPNPMPESVTDRPTKAHEYLFLLSKSSTYYYNADAIKDVGVSDANRGGNQKMLLSDGDIRGRDENPHCGLGEAWEPNGFRNKRSVWTIPTSSYKGAHFACYPPKLIEPCILAGSRPGDTILDPFNGAATTGCVALDLGRKYIGIELNPEYVELSHRRLTT